MTTETNIQTAGVIHHDSDGHGTPQRQTAAEWLGEPVRLGRELTADEAAKLRAYSGHVVECDLIDDEAAYLVEDASGITLAVYYADPLA